MPKGKTGKIAGPGVDEVFGDGVKFGHGCFPVYGWNNGAVSGDADRITSVHYHLSGDSFQEP